LFSAVNEVQTPMSSPRNGRATTTIAQQMAEFAAAASFSWLSDQAVARLKICVLDALGCAIGAIGMGPLATLREHTDEFAGARLCSLIGGGRSAPDRAAFYNGALVRYIDFNDSYLGEAGTCHPSDNLAAVFVAAEYADRSGKDFLTALAVAYQIQCRLIESVPVMAKGFDHCTFLSYAIAAGAAKALRLDAKRMAHAIALAGDSSLTLTVTRAHPMSNWKGFAAPQAAATSLHTTFLAKRGVTGPLHVFEGPKGFFAATGGTKADIDWTREDLESAARTTIKPHNAEVHAQSTIEAVLELRAAHKIKAAEVEKIEVEVFKVAYDIVGGGDWGDRKTVLVKEEADHSLPYLVAVALLDGQVQPKQFEARRIYRQDVQSLLQKVEVTPRHGYTSRYPREVRCQVTIRLKDGRELVREKHDFPGFVATPFTWDDTTEKFNRLAEPNAPAALRRKIIAAVEDLESIAVSDLAKLLSRARRQPAPRRRVRTASANGKAP
jgi:2-methylcitrate dehydratase